MDTSKLLEDIFGEPDEQTPKYNIDFLWDCIVMLPERYQIVLFKKYSGMSYAEIGKQLLNKNTEKRGVSSTLAREIWLKALRTLRHPRFSRIIKGESSIDEFLNYDKEQIINACLSKKHESLSQLRFEDFELSVRAQNALKNAGITTVGDIVLMSANEFLKTKNVGRKTFYEIRDFLHSIKFEVDNSWKI